MDNRVAGKDFCYEWLQDSDTYRFYAGSRKSADSLASVVQSALFVPGPNHRLSIGEAEKHLALLCSPREPFAGEEQGLPKWRERLAPRLM